MTEPTTIPVDNDMLISLGTSKDASSNQDKKESCDVKPNVPQVSPTSVKPNVPQVSPTSGIKENTTVVKPFTPRVTPEKRKKSYYYTSSYDKQVEQKKRFKRIPCHFFDIAYTSYWIHQHQQ